MENGCRTINDCLSLVKCSTLLKIEKLRLEVKIREMKFWLQSGNREQSGIFSDQEIQAILAEACDKVTMICTHQPDGEEIEEVIHRLHITNMLLSHRYGRSL